MKHVAFRLKKGQDLKKSIEQTAVEKNIKAGVLLSVVGCLSKAKLRMAGATAGNQVINEYVGPFELVSGTGTISDQGCHIHVAISDKDAKVIGGHLKDGCIVETTVEVVICVLEDTTFARLLDDETGFSELIVR